MLGQETRWVAHLPEKEGDAYFTRHSAYGVGMAQVILVVVKRVDGWTVYGMPEYLPPDYAKVYGVNKATRELVLSNGDTLYREDAFRIFPWMEENGGPYCD